MPILWNKRKTKYSPSIPANDNNVEQKGETYEIEVFQGDSVDLLEYIQFVNGPPGNRDLEIWERTLVNAAYYTDNGVSAPDAYGEYKAEFADDSEIRQYASKHALVWKCKIVGAPDPFGIANLLVDKFGVLDTSKTGVAVNMTLKVWANWDKQASQFKLPDPMDSGTNIENEYLTIKIKSNSLLGDGGLLNSVTGSVDKYVTDAMDYISGVLGGAAGYIGEGVGWASKQVTSLLGSKIPKGYTLQDANKQLESEKDRETNLFTTIIGFPVAALDGLTSGQYTPIIKSGIRALSLSAKLYRAYTQGKTAYVTTVLLANLKTLLDFDKLTRRQQIHISKFLGVNPNVLRRVTWVVRKILQVQELVDDGKYDELKNVLLKELDKKSIDDVDPEIKSIITGEIFEDISLGSVVVKNYEIPNKDTLVIKLDNPSYTKVPGNTLILTRIEIQSEVQGNGSFIPIKSVTNSAALKSGNSTIPDPSFANAVNISSTGQSCEITYNGTIGKETGVDFRSYGIFPSGTDVLTIQLDNSEFNPLFEYRGSNKIRKGYLPFKIKYHYIGNTTPLIEIQNPNGSITYEKADVILAEGESTTEEIGFDGFIRGSYAEKENADKMEEGFQTTKTAANALAVYNTYKKQQFLSIFDAVDFKNLPPAVQGLIVSVGGMVGVSQSEIIRYYEVLSGAKNLYELSTKGFQHYNSLPPELKKKISKQLGVSEDTLGTIIPIAGDLTDMATGKRFKSDKEKEDYFKGLFDSVGQKLLNQFGANGEVWEKYNKVVMEKDTSSGKMVRKVIPGQGVLDPKMKQTIAAALGFTDIKELKPPFEKNSNNEDITHIEVPGLSIVKCGIVIEKALTFRNNLAKGIEIKNRLLKKYESIKNTPNLLENEAAMMGVYDEIVDTREEIEKEGILKDIYDSAGELTADPYADLLDEAGPDKWRDTFNVDDKYVVDVPKTSAPDGGVTGEALAGNYVIYTYDWVTDIIQDSNTGEITLVGNAPPGFVYNPRDINWYIEIKK
jgi:hypothetical protein